jgi:predicted transcriptional regulator
MSIRKVSIRQIKAARALLEWSQDDLADRSGVGLATIKRLEAGSGEVGGRDATRDALMTTLEKAGIQFIPENGGGIGVRLTKSSAKPSNRKPLSRPG